MVRSLKWTRNAIVTVGLVAVLGGCMNASLSQAGAGEGAAGISLQNVPDSVEEIILTVSGPGIDTIEKTVDRDTDAITLEVPVGEDREFTAEAGGYSASIVSDVPAGGVTVTLRFGVSSDRSLDGTLLFWRGEYGEDDTTGLSYVTNADIYTIEADGTNEQQVTALNSPRIDTAFWTGDGEWIVFKSYHDEETSGELYRVRPDGSQLARLTNNTVPVSETLGGIEGAGSRVIYSRPAGDFTQVYVVDAAASSPTATNVSNDLSRDYGFTIAQDYLKSVDNVSVGRDVVNPWSPDGSQLLYSGGVESSFAVYLDDATGGTASLLDGNSPVEVGAQWLPDGETILYSAGNATDMDLWLYDVSADVFSQLTNSEGVIDKYPRISPDGTTVLFQRSGEYRLTDLSGNESPLSNALDLLPLFARWVPSSSELSVVGYNFNTGSDELRFYDTAGTLLETIPYDTVLSGGSVPLQWNASGTLSSGMIAETDELTEEVTQFDLTVFDRETEEVTQVTETSSLSEIGGFWRP